jgi:Tol biopolymer transport system component/DNA-binding winged helix-turn-helix (wHTH) protein
MDKPQEERRSIHFGPFEADFTTGELRKHGIRVKLQDQPFQILKMLLVRPGHLVTREEIRQSLWPSGTFVDFDNGLNAAVNRLREALNDSPQNPKFIETLPRRGYRFIGGLCSAGLNTTETQGEEGTIADPIREAPQMAGPPLRELEEIINKASQKNHDSRNQVMPEMRTHLGMAEPGAVSVADSGGQPVSLVSGALTATVHQRWPLVVAAVFALLLTVGAIFWRWEGDRRAFHEGKVKQLTYNSSENYVLNGAISPDGKYLAFTDGNGMHIKVIDTGETHLIPQPEILKDSRMSWEIGPWFPDSTRFLANAHPDPDTWSSQGASIWTVSLVGATPRRLRSEAVAYAISPDGASVAFGTNKGDQGEREIWLMAVNGDDARKLVGTDGKNTVGPLVWFPDGKRILYFATDESRNEALVARGLSGGPVTTIFRPPEMTKIRDIAVLPDGRLLYVLRESDDTNTCNYWELQVDTRTGERAAEPKRLTNWTGSCMNHTTVSADGKRIAFYQAKPHSNVYVADLESNGAKITTPRRLTLNEGLNYLDGWTADSKEVIFSSYDSDYRSGGVFRQPINSDSEEPIKTRVEGLGSVLVSPDGNSFLYQVRTKIDDPLAPVQIMRVPITGGPSQLVFVQKAGWFRWDCSKLQSNSCVAVEKSADGTQYVISAFDPIQGRGRELKRIDTYPGDLRGWALSPDGTRIATYIPQEKRIHITPLDSRPPSDVTIKRYKSIRYVRWAADGKSLFITEPIQGGGSFLLHVDFQGNAQVLWKLDDSSAWIEPSADGRHLAMSAWSWEGNLWMMENR